MCLLCIVTCRCCLCAVQLYSCVPFVQELALRQPYQDEPSTECCFPSIPFSQFEYMVFWTNHWQIIIINVFICVQCVYQNYFREIITFSSYFKTNKCEGTFNLLYYITPVTMFPFPECIISRHLVLFGPNVLHNQSIK